MEKPAATAVPIHDLLRRRWSPRAIDSGRALSPSHLEALVEALRWAPSCFNDQPWGILVFDDRDPEARDRARACLTKGNVWARSAPALLLTAAREAFRHNGKPNRHAQHDVGLGTENLMLQATALGLAAHAMAGFDGERARREFGIPEGWTPMAMIAVGYPGSPEELPEALRERERAARERLPAAEFAFRGAWGRPVVP